MKQAFKIIPQLWISSLILIAFTWILFLGLPLGILCLFENTQATYTSKERDYFKNIVLKSEYQKRLNPSVLKWQKDIYILVHGKPNAQDMATLKQVMRELNSLQSQIKLSLMTKNSDKINMHFYFQSESTFKALDSHYIPTNWGYFILSVLYQGEIQSAKILISTTGLSQLERDHIIREEFTQSLGLVNDSKRYKDSIFYMKWSKTTEFSPLDKKLIRLLYSPLIQAGDKAQNIDQKISESNEFKQCMTQFKCQPKARSKYKSQ